MASKFLAVGALVPWAEAGAGAVATQAYGNPRYGPEGLALLRAGAAAEAVVAQLVAADPDREQRQLGVVDAQGRSAAFTGASCHDWAGHRCGSDCNALVRRVTLARHRRSRHTRASLWRYPETSQRQTQVASCTENYEERAAS